MTEGGLAGQPAASNDRVPDARPSYRCFLFADLRGYTSYIERAGNAAGVELLDGYLAITRAAVTQYDGAEIKVEGDGFHAVFPSASSAVMCALAIVRAADEATTTRPDRPMRVGIGVHAGEAVETADGFIGSAVNLASRVCDTAAAGEVLVTGTVRGITQASIPVTFVSRGRRRLKGIDEPVELFAALPQGDKVAAPPSSMRMRWLAVGAAVVVALAVVVGAMALPGLGTPPATPSPPPPTPRPLAIGPLQLGTHVADEFRTPFSFTIDDPGWNVYRVYPDALGLHYEDAVVGRLDIGHIPLLYSDACIPDGNEVATGTSIDDLESALRSVPFLQVGETQAAEISGNYAITVDVTVDPGAQAACGGFGEQGIALFPTAEDVWDAVPGEVFRLRAVDIEGTTIAFVMSAETAPAGSVSELHQFFARAERVIQNLRFL